MELNQLIECLADPRAYPGRVDVVEVRQTHISAVFLAGEHVYKVKKPVRPAFLDFGTLEKRRHYCEEEVRLNSRLSPSVYLGVVPIVADGDSGDNRIRIGNADHAGEAIEWAVKMRRLPDDVTLEKRLLRGEVDAALVEKLATRIAEFHRQAERSERIAEFGHYDVVANNARENFEHSRASIGIAVSEGVFERLQQRTEEALARGRQLIESRAARGVPCDTHGDLHLDHVYLFPDKPPPEDLIIIDCIEFNERFRFADPVADMAFMTMDLRFHGRRDLADVFARQYFEAADDAEGRQLLPFYSAYRAVVRAKVDGIKLMAAELSEQARQKVLPRARGRWLLALGELEEADRRPCLILVGGLPGSGKSTLARMLAEQGDFVVLRSDVIRKELAGAQAGQPAAFGEGIYTPAWTQQTYQTCLERAEAALFDGRRVIVDASFVDDRHRQHFIECAIRNGVPMLFLHCVAPEDVVRQRLKNRRNDASDADFEIYQQAANRWQPAETMSARCRIEIRTDAPLEEVLQRGQQALRDANLLPA